MERFLKRTIGSFAGKQRDGSPARFFGVPTVESEHKNRPCALAIGGRIGFYIPSIFILSCILLS